MEKDAGESGKARIDPMDQKMKAEQSLASVQAEKQALMRKLEELDAELSETLVDSARRTAEQRKALDEMAKRAARLEKEVVALSGSESADGQERGSSLSGSSRRIVELEKEKEALTSRLSVVESERDRALAEEAAHREREAQLAQELSRARTALAEMTGREDAQRAALAAASQRTEQLEKEAAAVVGREAKLSREWEASRSEWSERLRQADSLREERQTLVTLLVAAERARDRALGEVTRLGEAHRAEVARREDAHRSELSELRPLVERLKSAVATAAQKEAQQAAAWQAAREELQARIAQLEEGGVGAAGDKSEPPSP